MDYSRSQADEPLLVAGELRLLLSEYLVVRIVFGEGQPPAHRKGARSEKLQ